MFRKLIAKKMKHNQEEVSKVESNEKKVPDIIDYLDDITTILDIDCPVIQRVACLFESDGMIQAQSVLDQESLPDDASFLCGYFLPDQNLLVLPRLYPLCSTDNPDLRFVPLTIAEQIFTIAHELRHVWQLQYHSELYSYNATGLEVIDDPSEVDADAFALVYTFSDKTPFKADDIPSELEEICLQATLDKEKRWARAKELAADYSFGNYERIQAVREACDFEKIRKYLTVLEEA